jgi:hypothetical protein
VDTSHSSNATTILFNWLENTAARACWRTATTRSSPTTILASSGLAPVSWIG